METVESSENMALLIVIALIVILGFCIIDLIFYKLFKRKPKNKEIKNKKDDTTENLNSIEKQLAELDEMEKSDK